MSSRNVKICDHYTTDYPCKDVPSSLLRCILALAMVSCILFSTVGCGSENSDESYNQAFYFQLKDAFPHATLCETGYYSSVYIDNINPPYGVTVSWYQGELYCDILFHNWHVPESDLIKLNMSQGEAIHYLSMVK